MADEQTKGFKVTDRRIFSEDGAADMAGKTHSPGNAVPDNAPPDFHEPVPDPKGAPSDRHAAMPPVDFQTFVISIGSTALLSLGVLENPETGQRTTDLVLAKHNIDLLAMLEQKTHGNLTAAEAKLLSSLLYDLRLKFVEIARSTKS